MSSNLNVDDCLDILNLADMVDSAELKVRFGLGRIQWRTEGQFTNPNANPAEQHDTNPNPILHLNLI